MGYSSPGGHRPIERASKASHQHLIRNREIQTLLQQCVVPEVPSEPLPPDRLIRSTSTLEEHDVQLIITVDGGYSEVPVRETFPSATMAFFQFGALAFTTDDLNAVSSLPFPGPDDMARLKSLERLGLAIPCKNVRLSGQPSFVAGFRAALHRFLVSTEIDGASLASTLKWLIFEEFDQSAAIPGWPIAQNPYTGNPVTIIRADLDSEFRHSCPETGSPIYLVDALRLHERVDEEIGAAGVLGYLTNVIEMLLAVHMIRSILRMQPNLLRRTLFIKDGPLGFFGQTARLHRPMRRLIAHLQSRWGVNFVGLEKSGAFVDHAWEIRNSLNGGTALLLDNQYIYRRILPGQGQVGDPYGSTSLFGAKAIYKTTGGYVHVLSCPTLQPDVAPTENDYIGLQAALAALERLQCHMHDNAVVPVALANRLVSLSVAPSQSILQTFARASVRYGS